MFWKIVTWAGIPLSAILFIYDFYVRYKDAPNYGIPDRVWYFAPYLILCSSFIAIIIGLIFENRKIKNISSIEVLTRLREEKIKQRQRYTNLKQEILDTLLNMDAYLANVVDNQDINVKQFVSAYHKAMDGMLLSNFVGVFTYSSNSMKHRFLNYNMKLTLTMLSRLNTALKDYKLGTLVALSKDDYKKLDKRIHQLDNVFSLKIRNDVNQVILYCQIVNCLRLVNPDRSFWNRLQIEHLNQKRVLTFKTMLATSQWQIVNVMDNARGQVAEDIDKYLLGDDL